MKNVIVTGANGFIGSTLVNNLLENDNKKTVTTEEFLKAVASKL